jgi:2-polyprenyl-3-methyl-5-hydroxy-6-metoxy-1,4-benzoquinol methylase
MNNLKFLKKIRIFELKIIEAIIDKHSSRPLKILEIGAGTGWQSRMLAESGHDIKAIDLANSSYAEDRTYNIVDYDGEHIPFAINEFDIIFSSNVLEHIPAVVSFQEEIKRVLRPDGLVIHLIPSSTWRFWSSISHYLLPLMYLLGKLSSKIRQPKAESHDEKGNNLSIDEKVRSLSVMGIVRRLLWPSRHGEFGNSLTEIYYFSQYRWHKLFINTGWSIVTESTNELFYTCKIFESRIGIKRRQRLSHFLGSSCNLYVLKKQPFEQKSF